MSSAGEVCELGVGRVFRRHTHGLERHAADRAMARSLLHDLRVHGAGVERALRQGLGVTLLVKVALGVFRELRSAAFRAEMINVVAVAGARPSAIGIDHHSADGVDCHCLCVPKT